MHDTGQSIVVNSRLTGLISRGTLFNRAYYEG